MNKRDLLRELVGRLHADGTPIPGIYHEACTLNEQLDRPVANANDLVREIVGPYTAPRPSQEQLRRDYQCWRPPESWRPKAGSDRDVALVTPEQARQAKRDRERAARLMAMIRDDVDERVREIVAAELPDALDCLSKRKRA